MYQVMINASGFLLRLLVDSRYRIFRHFLLFFLSMLIISVNFYLDLIEGKESLIRSSIAQSLILLIPIYLSVFILTPRLLLKNKLGKYVISVFLVIAVAILFSYLLRQEDIEREYKLYQFWLAAFFFISSIIQLSLIIAGASAVIVFQDYVKYGQRIDELENATMQSELEQLKNQINPHFLFNNLNAGIALIDYAPDKAVDFFTSMSRVFRTVLDRSMESTQSLNEELDDLQQYLNLLRIRFGEAIKIDVWLSDTERNMEILTGSLQLVFENIVKHNKFSADNPITVSVLTDKDTLMVINDFRPLSDKSGSRGIGHSALIHRYEDFGRHNISFRQDGDKYISQIPLFPAK